MKNWVMNCCLIMKFLQSKLPLLLAAVGSLLRIFPAWAMPMWYDENFTLLVARLPLDKLIQATAGDVHPPLFYLLVWPLAHIPGLVPWLVVRLPSILAGIASLYVFWAILEWMEANKTVQLVAFGLFCFLPQQIYYSQEGRMYSLLTLLVLLAWLLIMEAQAAQPIKYVWLAVVASAMLWLQNYGLLYAAALWLAAIVYDRHTWKPLTIALAAAGLSFVPWLFVLSSQMTSISGNYWMFYFSLPSLLGDFAHVFFAKVYINFDMLNVAVFYGLLTWVLIWSIRKRTLNLPAVILAFLPLVLVAIVSVLWQPIMLFRALIPSAAFICLLLAEPIEYLGRKPVLLLAIFFLPVLLINLGNVVVRSGWASKSIQADRDAISYIDTNWKQGDLLYYVDDGTFVSGSVSWQNIDNVLQEPQCGMVRGGLTLQTQEALGMRSGYLPANYPGRIWVISGVTSMFSECFDDYLRDNGLMDNPPLFCSQDNALVKSCLYLVEPKSGTE